MNKGLRRPDWDDVKIDIMRRILRTKADQHEYVRRKLLETGDRDVDRSAHGGTTSGAGDRTETVRTCSASWRMEIRAELAFARLTNAGEDE